MATINRHHSSFIFYPFFVIIFNTIYQIIPDIMMGSSRNVIRRYVKEFISIVFEYLDLVNSILIILFFLFVIGNGIAKSYPVYSRKDIGWHVIYISLFVVIGIILFHTLMFALLFWNDQDDLLMHYSRNEYFTLYEPIGLDPDVGIELSLLQNTIIDGIVRHIPDLFLIGIVFILVYLRTVVDKDVNLYPDENTIEHNDQNNKDHTKQVDPVNTETNIETITQKRQIPTSAGLVAITLIDYVVIAWGSYKILFDENILQTFAYEHRFFVRMMIGIFAYIIPTILSIIGYHYFLDHEITIGLQKRLKEIGKHLLLILATLAIFPVTLFILFISGVPVIQSSNEFVTIFLKSPFRLFSDETGKMAIYLLFNLMRLVFMGLHVFLSFTLVRLWDQLETI